MNAKLYVAGFPYTTGESELADLFSEYGQVDSVKIIINRDTGKSRGFGFVEMQDAGSAKNAMKALEGTEFGGRNLMVNEARERR